MLEDFAKNLHHDELDIIYTWTLFFTVRRTITNGTTPVLSEQELVHIDQINSPIFVVFLVTKKHQQVLQHN